jgi:hypothetical protein
MNDLENKDIFEISEILLHDVKDILKDISGYSLSELFDSIIEYPESLINDIYSSEKIIKDSTLVKKGIYPYRAILSERTVNYRREKLGFHTHPNFNGWNETGCVIIENFLPQTDFSQLQFSLNQDKKSGYSIDLSQNKEFVDLVKMCLATPENLGYHPSLGSEHVIHYSNDDQVNLHSDIFHPNLKIWLYINDCNLENGPYSFVFGSHKKTPKMLEFIHKHGLIWNEGPSHPEFFKYNASPTAIGSPRILRSENCDNNNMEQVNQELSKLDLPPVTVIEAKQNTIIFTDTTGFHARGYAASGAERYSLRNAFRINPFMI